MNFRMQALPTWILSVVPLSAHFVARTETNGRENNEDGFLAFLASPVSAQGGIVVLAVADGMGGLEHGEHVSREALRHVGLFLFEHLLFEPTVSNPEPLGTHDAETASKIIWGALEHTNAYVRRMILTNNWTKAGSTVVVALIMGDTVIAANLGDSALFHFQTGTGNLERITEDHTVAGVLMRAGMITSEMARYHEGRSRLEFYLGNEGLPRDAPVYRLRLSPGDILLLCTDGVSGAIPEGQMAEILRGHLESLQMVADRLVLVSREAGETDNQTLILWRHPRLSEPLPSEPATTPRVDSDDTELPAIPQGGTPEV